MFARDSSSVLFLIVCFFFEYDKRDFLKLVDLLVGQFLYAMFGAALPIYEKLWALNGGVTIAKMKNFFEGYCTLWWRLKRINQHQFNAQSMQLTRCWFTGNWSAKLVVEGWSCCFQIFFFLLAWNSCPFSAGFVIVSVSRVVKGIPPLLISACA